MDEQVGDLAPRPSPPQVRPRTPEELRSAIVQGIDGVLSAWVSSRFLSEDDKRLLRAQRRYWQADGGFQLAVLLQLLNEEP